MYTQEDICAWSHEKLKKEYDELKEALRCSICLDTFVEPVVLPCVHTFCLDCLNNHVLSLPITDNGLDTKCPLCRHPFLSYLTNDDSKPRLTPNYFVRFQLDHLHKIKTALHRITSNASDDIDTCEVCEESHKEDAYSRCLTCNLNVCETHELDHEAHKVVNIADIDDLPPILTAPPKTCRAHPGQPLAMDCCDCRIIYCLICHEEGTHKNHKVQTFEQYVAEIKSRCCVNITALERQRREIEISLNLIDQMETKVQETMISQKEKIISAIDHLKRQNAAGKNTEKKIENRREAILNELEERSKTKLSKLSQQRKQLEADLDCLDITVLTIRSIIKNAPEDRMEAYLSITNEPIKRFQDDPGFSRPPVETTHLEFIMKSAVNFNGDLHELHLMESKTNLVTPNPFNPHRPIFDDTLSFNVRTPSLIIGGKGKANGQFNIPRNVAIDKDNNILVCDSGNKRIEIFNEKGEFLKSISTLGAGHSRFILPFGLAVDNKGNIILGDRDCHRIQVFSSQGKSLRVFGAMGSKKGRMNKPSGIVIDKDNNIVVCDSRNHRVQIFDEQGRFLRCFGTQGSAPGKFNSLSGIDIDRSTGNFITCDFANHRIQTFDPTGKFIRTAGRPGTGLGEFTDPSFVAVDHSGNIIVSDTASNRIQIFDPDWNLLSAFGRLGVNSGEFNAPHGVAVDHKNRIIVCDTMNHRIQIFE